MKRTPLTRKTPMPRGTAAPKQRKPMPRAAAPKRAPAEDAPARRAPRATPKRAQRDTGPSAATREAVKQRDGGRCVRCDAPAGSIHHRSGRGMGGRQGEHSDRINQPAWLLCLCGSGVTGCHGWVEDNRTKAEALGYLIRRGDPDQDAEARPVRTLRGWRLFGNDLTVTRTTAPQGEAA